MRGAYSHDLRERVVQAVPHGDSCAVAAGRFDVSKSSPSHGCDCSGGPAALHRVRWVVTELFFRSRPVTSSSSSLNRSLTLAFPGYRTCWPGAV